LCLKRPPSLTWRRTAQKIRCFCVEYVAGQPEIAAEINAIYAAYLALPAHLRPVAVPWDPDNDRPTDPVHTGPYTNPDQLRHLEQLHARLGL
jgi:hypothetical protein